MAGTERVLRGARMLCVAFLMGTLWPGIGASYEGLGYDTHETVYRDGKWVANCESNSNSKESYCYIIFLGDRGDGMLRMASSGTSDIEFLSDEFSYGLLRVSIDGEPGIDVSCQYACGLYGATARMFHAALMDGSRMRVERATLPGLFDPLEINVSNYRAAYAAIVKWNETH